MNFRKIAITILITLILWAIVFLIIKATLTGQAIAKDYYTYTKAICDEDNFCQDYEIICENKEVISATPISGAVIQHSENWEDPRVNKSEIICK